MVETIIEGAADTIGQAAIETVNGRYPRKRFLWLLVFIALVLAAIALYYWLKY